jgi:multicomponent Na+:H+ antiporter subunit B
MSRRTRTILFLVAAGLFASVFVIAAFGLPAFGGDVHPYRDASVPAALARSAPNVVSALVFDQRGIDTMGELTIVLGSVVGAATLLRLADDEREARDTDTDSNSRPGPLPLARLLGFVLLPVALVLGVNVVVHGHLTPGGGFQGGVVLATGLHLLYVAGDYRALRRLRPLSWYHQAEAAGTGAYVLVGCAGLLVGRQFLANVLPYGQSGALFSSGTVAVLSVAVGVEVAGGVVVLLAQFLEQAISVRTERVAVA